MDINHLIVMQLAVKLDDIVFFQELTARWKRRRKGAQGLFISWKRFYVSDHIKDLTCDRCNDDVTTSSRSGRFQSLASERQNVASPVPGLVLSGSIFMISLVSRTMGTVDQST